LRLGSPILQAQLQEKGAHTMSNIRPSPFLRNALLIAGAGLLDSISSLRERT
jgi:hypothetical protein